MKQKVKKDNRQKAVLGAILSAGVGLLTNYLNGKAQDEINENNKKHGIFSDNFSRSIESTNDATQAFNANRAQEMQNSKTDSINTMYSGTGFKLGGDKKLRRKYKNYTDPYAKDWYLSIFRNDRYQPIGVSKHQLNQDSINAADYVESMYRYHQKKYLHDRDSIENTPTFIGPQSPKGYIPNTVKKALQFGNYDEKDFGPYNNNFPDLPADYNKYKCGGQKRMKVNGGTITSDINKLSKYI